MKGPAKYSPSRWQQRLYKMKPVYSSPICAAIIPGQGAIVGVLVVPRYNWGAFGLTLAIMFLGSWPLIHFTRKDRRMMLEERMEQETMYFPPASLPIAEKRHLLLYPLAGAVAGAVIATRSMRTMVADSPTPGGSIVVLLGLVTAAIFAAVVVKSARVRAWAQDRGAP